MIDIYIHSGETKEKLEVRSKIIYYYSVRCIVACPIILSINIMRPKHSFIGLGSFLLLLLIFV